MYIHTYKYNICISSINSYMYNPINILWISFASFSTPYISTSFFPSVVCFIAARFITYINMCYTFCKFCIYPYISRKNVTGTIADPPSGSWVNNSQIIVIVSKRLEPKSPTAIAKNFFTWHFRRNFPIIKIKFRSRRSKHKQSHSLSIVSTGNVLL